MQCKRDLLAVLHLMLEVAPHVRGETSVLDSQHDLQVDVEAAKIEVRRTDVHEVVDYGEFGVELGKQLANGLLPALRGEAEASDPVTKVLLAELKARA